MGFEGEIDGVNFSAETLEHATDLALATLFRVV